MVDRLEAAELKLTQQHQLQRGVAGRVDEVLFALEQPGRQGTRGPWVRAEGEWGMVVPALDREGGKAYPVAGAAVHRRHDVREEAEHARLLYVAMTRARDWLVLSGALAARGAKGSWLEALDRQYSLRDREDGAVIDGDEWQLTLRRTVPEVSPHATSKPDVEDVSEDTIRRRLEAVLAPEAGVDRFAVTHLAKEMADATAARVDDEYVTDRSDGRERGRLMHRVLECWATLGDTEKALNYVARERVLLDKEEHEFREAPPYRRYGGKISTAR